MSASQAEEAGSIPVSCSIEKPRSRNGSGAFLCSLVGCFPLYFPFTAWLCLRYALDILLHPGGTGLLHLIGNMAVHVQSKGSGSVAQIALHCFDVVPGQ